MLQSSVEAVGIAYSAVVGDLDQLVCCVCPQAPSAPQIKWTSEILQEAINSVTNNDITCLVCYCCMQQQSRIFLSHMFRLMSKKSDPT